MAVTQLFDLHLNKGLNEEVLLVLLQEVGLKSRPECRSIPPPQYYSQIISEMETLGWDK